MTDVSAGFRPPCWCPSMWAPAWRLHTNLYKFGENVSPRIFHKKNYCDLNLGESPGISTFFLFPDSGLNLLNGFDFLIWSILTGVTLKTSNWFLLRQTREKPLQRTVCFFMEHARVRQAPSAAFDVSFICLQKTVISSNCQRRRNQGFRRSIILFVV